ncbi:MAG: hypothetical protein AABZ83_01585, partial [candidate division NC10 bacterium]
MSVLLVGASLLFLDPLRHGALAVLRLPFILAKTGVAILTTLPHLPSLARENASLQTALLQRQVEEATLREALRHAQQADRLLEGIPPDR